MHPIVAGWIVVAVALVLLWMRQLRTADATSVDVAWSFSLVFLAVLYGAVVPGDSTRRLIVAAMAVIWAARLGGYLLINRVFGHVGEDGRYKYLREYWAKRAAIGFFFFYQAQALFAIIFSLPIFSAMHGGAFGTLAWCGVGVWAVSVIGESVADLQLARFRADPANRGKVCQAGLWRYSRHPNYFFEWLQWWGYVLIAGGAWLSFVGPAAMLLFLFRLTGIPHTEAQSLRSRGEAYRTYQRTTSIFIPWFRKTS